MVFPAGIKGGVTMALEQGEAAQEIMPHDTMPAWLYG